MCLAMKDFPRTALPIDETMFSSSVLLHSERSVCIFTMETTTANQPNFFSGARLQYKDILIRWPSGGTQEGSRNGQSRCYEMWALMLNTSTKAQG